ncbi:uncharacterized protein LOC130940579 [Arachis stenosperma]|uniref:uncharacterized protein LOC130940579 n=1 Tax=Arachis stenosperma TaxID=217475 RepID=UPI0025ACA00C|nr:uncharacterized protein LOC130940579 [Arachis stenosperma]
MARLLLLHPVLSAVVLGLLVALSTPGASARPCRSFLISSYTFSLPSSDDPSLPSSSTLTTFAEIYSFRHFPAKVFFTRSISDSSVGMTEPHRRSPETRPAATLGFSAEEFGSLRDRTKDLLSVVAALLFGVGCGALTATTIYLVWSSFSSRHDYRYDDYLDDEEDEKINSSKKLGYVKIPEAEAEAIPAPTKDAV